MTTLEDVLSEAMSPNRTSAHPNWDRIERSVAVRARRRTAVFRVAVIGFVLMIASAAFGGLGGSLLDTTPDAVLPAESVVSDTSFWPSVADVSAELGVRPKSQFWMAWFAASVVPFALGLRSWMRAPAHLRAIAASQRWARLVLAVATALRAQTIFGLVLGLFLLVRYDPLAAQTGTSLLLSVARVVRVNVYVLVASLAVVHQAARLAPGRSVWRSLSFTIGGVGWAWLWLLPLSWIDVMIASGFGWTRINGSSTRARGLWRLFVPSDGRVFLDSTGGELTVSSAWTTLAFLAVGSAGAWWVSRSLIRAVLAGERLQPGGGSPGRRSRIAAGLCAVAVVLPLWSAVARDARAQSVAHLVGVPLALDDVANVRVERNVSSNPLEDWLLVEVRLVGQTSAAAEALAETPDNELLPASSGFVARGGGFWRNQPDPPGVGPGAREYWTVERGDGVTLRGEVDPFSGQPRLTVPALYFSAVLVLFATSSTVRNIAADRILGRVAAGWLALGISLWILGGLIRSFIQVEAVLEPLVGMLDETVDRSLLDDEAVLGVHRLWSDGAYLFRSFALLPAGMLMAWAFVRLTGRRWMAAVVGGLVLVAVVVSEIRWGAVITAGNDIVE